MEEYIPNKSITRKAGEKASLMNRAEAQPEKNMDS